MNALKKLTGKLLAASFAAVSLLAAAPSSAGVIQLGFILDRSDSIPEADWDLITAGLASAINTHVPTNGRYEVSVVTFNDSAAINIDGVLVDSVAARTTLANSITALGALNTSGFTNYAAAFAKMQEALTNGTGITASAAEKSYVNFTTDGNPNRGGYTIETPAYCSKPQYTTWLACWLNGGDWINPPDIEVSANQAGIDARDALIAAGIDNISIEGIGGVDANNLKNNYCYPQACTTLAGNNFDLQGFYIGVDTAQQYVDAVAEKIQAIVEPEPGPEPVPEPATLALLGVGLAALSATRRRRSLRASA